MRWLVLGATGMLGEAFLRAMFKRGDIAMTAARGSDGSRPDRNVDITNDEQLLGLLAGIEPDGVINCAANIFIDQCEADPAMAYRVNARPLSLLADWSRKLERPLIQISTDHYFVEGERSLQPETAPVTLVNEYARSKWIGEQLALLSPHSLVLRTNIVGAMKGHGRWVATSLRDKGPMTLFMDFFASPIHVDAMATAALDLYDRNGRGVYNLASRDVSSKGEFIYAVAKAMQVTPDWVVEGSGRQLATKRAMCLGLDVSRAEKTLGYKLPTLEETARALAEEPL